MSLVTQCRTMAAGGWSPYRIHGLLMERGVSPCPSRSTVLYWCREDSNEAHRERSRREEQQRLAERATFKLSGKSVPYQEAFILELRRRGVSVAAIATVTSVVLEEAWNEEAVRRLLYRRADELAVEHEAVAA